MTENVNMKGATMNTVYQQLEEVTAFLKDVLDATNLTEIEDNLVNNGPDVLERCEETLSQYTDD